MRLVAASLSFSTILSLVPFLAVVLSAFKLMGGFDILYPKVEQFIFANLTAGASKDVVTVVSSAIRRVHAGRLGTTGAVVLIFIAMKLLDEMEWAIHRVWNIPTRRPLMHRIFGYWFFMLLIPVMLAIYVGFLSIKKILPWGVEVPTYVFNGIALVGVLYVVYKVVPNVRVKKAPALFSAIVVSILMTAVQATYAWVAKSFFAYSKLYGSVAVVPIFLIWILTIWYLILGGEVVTASTQRRELLTELVPE
ncbi:MAG: YhjD/YihY/BrkB family envelope integrity protein [Pseudobdellovibrionaceae bacterium]